MTENELYPTPSSALTRARKNSNCFHQKIFTAKKQIARSTWVDIGAGEVSKTVYKLPVTLKVNPIEADYSNRHLTITSFQP